MRNATLAGSSAAKLVVMDETGGTPDEVGEDEVRRLIEAWLSEPPTLPELPELPEPAELPELAEPASGLAVPPAAADVVVAAARRLATEEDVAAEDLGAPDAGLRLLAEVMVLDEHPSAATWTCAERTEVLDWLTLLIHRFGEDGVQRLVAALCAAGEAE
ncbi:hypothetical protein [Kitasatospora sp. LaBMicrA B282]|uniref:hypothetical protein n=1 Tax=Kitasatospora sp. LaBMicrA B282 TaxID=3420949 RepID=UPI003D0A5644